jgi:hypothetical protein
MDSKGNAGSNMTSNKKSNFEDFEKINAGAIKKLLI